MVAPSSGRSNNKGSTAESKVTKYKSATFPRKELGWGRGWFKQKRDFHVGGRV